VNSCTSEQERLQTHGRIWIKQCMSTTVSVQIQSIEQTDGVTVYAADKQCNYVQYTLQCTTTLTLCACVIGLRMEKTRSSKRGAVEETSNLESYAKPTGKHLRTFPRIALPPCSKSNRP